MQPRIAASFLAVFVLGSVPAARAQAVLLPGQVYDNVPAVGFVEKRTRTRMSIDGTALWEESSVAFSRRDDTTQIMKLYTWSKGGIPSGAEAIGQYRLEFCVPRPGQSACDAVSDPAAPDIAVKITFGYGVVGIVHAFGLGSKAELNVLARVKDLERNVDVAYQNIESLSASTGTIKVVKKIPVPIPAFSNATITSPAAFTTILKRGRRYEFQLRARAYALSWDGRFIQTPGGYASGDLSTSVLNHFPEGFVSLRNLSFEVSPDTDLTILELRSLIHSLQEQVGSVSRELNELRQSLLERGTPESGECDTAPPGSDWVCTNGGWVPPNHPLAPPPGDPAPAPPVPIPPATPCPGSAPGPNWVCVNGGWLPPNHPLARGGG